LSSAIGFEKEVLSHSPSFKRAFGCGVRAHRRPWAHRFYSVFVHSFLSAARRGLIFSDVGAFGPPARGANTWTITLAHLESRCNFFFRKIKLGANRRTSPVVEPLMFLASSAKSLLVHIHQVAINLL